MLCVEYILELATERRLHLTAQTTWESTSTSPEKRRRREVKKRDLKKRRKRGTQELKLFKWEKKISPKTPNSSRQKRDWISSSFCLHVCSLVESLAKLIFPDKILDSLAETLFARVLMAFWQNVYLCKHSYRVVFNGPKLKKFEKVIVTATRVILIEDEWTYGSLLTAFCIALSLTLVKRFFPFYAVTAMFCYRYNYEEHSCHRY